MNDEVDIKIIIKYNMLKVTLYLKIFLWKIFVENDLNLLDAMMLASKKQSNLYKPGKFWAQASKVSARKMKKDGITEFRGRSGLVGQGFTRLGSGSI